MRSYEVHAFDFSDGSWSVALTTTDPVEAVFSAHDETLFPGPARIYEDGHLVEEAL